jgi:2-keto-3-deoxy-L-fuconate dehydrogenase
MTGRLAGKVAVVTAAGQGIGRAIAEAIAQEGASVHASDLHADKLDGLAAASARALDVRDVAGIARYAEEIGPVDILVNCVGYVAHGTVLDCDDASWDLSFDVNVRSAHRMIKAFLPGMLERAAGSAGKASGGSIINISSAASSVKGVANRYVYGASKAALIGMTKAIAVDFIGKGIRCNAICPGTVQSPSLDERIAALAASTGAPVEQVRADFIGRQPMGRLGTPQEIAWLAVYLARDESAFTTGLAHVIDGGWSA